MTKAFNELINSQHILHELVDPPVPGTAPQTAVKPEWVKDAEIVIGKCYPGTVNLLNSDLYYKTVGKIAQRNVSLTFYPVQDLIRELYAVKVVNKYELAAKILPWDDFLKNVQDNIDESAVQSVLTQWKTQLQDGDYEGYTIKNAALAKEYANKRKDKEALSTAALSVYNNDTIYNALMGIVERRITPLQKFEGEIARRLGNATKYETVLREILNNPEQVAASVKKLPADFFKYCDISDRDLLSLSLASAAFYKSEVARIGSLAIDRKVKEQAAATPATPAAKARYNTRDARGRFTKKLDLASLQMYDDILSLPSFERFAHKKDILTEADLWQNISTYVERYGGKAIQGIWTGIKYSITGTKKLPSSITEYENFLKTGIIKTTIKVPENQIVPGGSSEDVELPLDSSKEMINNRAFVYNVGFISNLADQPNAKEAQELRDILRSLSEHIGREDNEDYITNAVRSFAAAS